MTKSEAEAIINGSKTIEDFNETQTSQPVESSEPSTVDDTESTAVNTDETDTSSEPVRDEENSVSTYTDVTPEKGKADVKSKKGKNYSPIEKQRHAFAKEKDRRREAQAKLGAKMKEIEALKAKLKKYEGLSLENFNGDNEAFTDYKIDQRLDNEKVTRMQAEYDQEAYRAQAEEANQIAEYRLQTNFPDEDERNKYQNLIMNAESNYGTMHPEIGYERFSEFLMSEPDRTVISYLQDSDNSPKLIRHFIHKPEAALRIMQMRNPYNKIVELKQLENRMMQHERVMASKGKQLNTTKRELPNTGKIVTNSNMNTGFDWNKPLSKTDAEALLAKKH